MVDEFNEDVNDNIGVDEGIDDVNQKAKPNGRDSGSGAGTAKPAADNVKRLPNTLNADSPFDCALKFRKQNFTYKAADDVSTLYSYRGRFYAWEGSRYDIVSDYLVRARLWRWLHKAEITKAMDGERKRKPFNPKSGDVSNILDALRAVCQVDDSQEPPFWLGDPSTRPDAKDFFAAANVLLHVPSMKVWDHTPQFFNVTASEVKYDLAAPEPKQWIEFMEQVFPDDSESIEQVEQFGGYLLLPDTRFQKALLMIGKPRSGKGTILEVYRQIVGGSASTSTTMTKLGTQFGMQCLLGKHLAIMPDLRLSKKIDLQVVSETLLSVTGRDAVNASQKYTHDWVGTMDVRFASATNDVPEFKDESGALIARFVVIKHRISFLGREDPDLREKIFSELPGILLRFLRARQRLYKNNGFKIPDSAASTVGSMASMASPVKAFISECCVVGKDESVSSDELYNEYVIWCKAGGEKPNTKEKFGSDLHEIVDVQKLRKRLKGTKDRANFYEGIGLLLGDIDDV